MGFRPQRYTVWITGAVVPLVLVAILYKQFVADNELAVDLMVFALLVGVVGVFLLMRDFGAWQQGKIAESPAAQGATIKAKSVGRIGLALMVGSFASLGLLFVWPDLNSIFPVWVVVFLAGTVMAFWPALVKWVAACVLPGRR